ncbi:unnamed protein product [Parajaminaea phylloscopi]
MADFDATVTYPPTTVFWPSEGSVQVYHWGVEQTLLLQVSIEWLRLGNVSTYGYIAEQCRATYEAEDGILVRSDGTSIANHETVCAGDIYLQTATTARPQPRVGPRFKYKYRPSNDGESDGTMSDSKRSTLNQSKFHLHLIARDSRCLITDSGWEGCTAAHILPQSRPEYYAEVLGRMASTTHLFLPAYGVLLRDDLHHAFDRGEIAFYPQGENLVVHVFYLKSGEVAQYHGKILTPDRFRCEPYHRPSVPLLRFHYEQCAMKYLRCFDWRLAPPA